MLPQDTTTFYRDATCENCGTIFAYRLSSKHRGRFCSRTCAPNAKRPLADRFWEKVNKDGPIPAHRPELGQCWVWTAGPGESGYGAIRGEGKRAEISAHRVSWELHFGNPGDLWVLHRCDNRLCVRPDHLFLGTAADNIHDAMDKGRMDTRGEKHGAARLTEDQVREIRSRYAAGSVFQYELAAEFGVGQVTVSRIIGNLRWRHVK